MGEWVTVLMRCTAGCGRFRVTRNRPVGHESCPLCRAALEPVADEAA